MDFFINELSLHGQFPTPASFISALEVIVQCRTIIKPTGHNLYCDKNISERLVYGETQFKAAMGRHLNKTLTSEVMNWFAKSGPFVTEVRTHSADEYFAYREEIVTDTTLGEVAFRVGQGQEAATLSFAPSDFMLTPLNIIWERPPEAQTIEVENFWESATLATYLTSLQAAPQSWPEFAQRCRTEFTQLVFLESFDIELQGEPFSPTIAERAWHLLKTLQDFQQALDPLTGSFNKHGMALLDQYFSRGETSLFSDSSPTEKNLFRKELTFRLPDGQELECFFHGKIRHRVYRLHHSWPPKLGEPLYIAYLGPKITKR